MTKKYPERAFFTIRSILIIFGGEFKEDTSESQSLVPVSGGRNLSVFQRALRFIRFPGTEIELIERKAEAIEKKWEKERMKKLIDGAIEQCTTILLQSPLTVQKETEEFLKNILRSDEYSKVHKDIALKIYGDFSLEKLDKLSHQ